MSAKEREIVEKVTVTGPSSEGFLVEVPDRICRPTEVILIIVELARKLLEMSVRFMKSRTLP